MAAWPGGACPECGDQMPANLIRCATCRGLLNPDLQPKCVSEIEFVELKGEGHGLAAGAALPRAVDWFLNRPALKP